MQDHIQSAQWGLTHRPQNTACCSRKKACFRRGPNRPGQVWNKAVCIFWQQSAGWGPFHTSVKPPPTPWEAEWDRIAPCLSGGCYRQLSCQLCTFSSCDSTFFLSCLFLCVPAHTHTHLKFSRPPLPKNSSVFRSTNTAECFTVSNHHKTTAKWKGDSGIKSQKKKKLLFFCYKILHFWYKAGKIFRRL